VDRRSDFYPLDKRKRWTITFTLAKIPEFEIRCFKARGFQPFAIKNLAPPAWEPASVFLRFEVALIRRDHPKDAGKAK